MTITAKSEITTADVEVAREDVRRGIRGLVLAVAAVLGIASALGGAIAAELVPSGNDVIMAFATGVAAMVIGLPFILATSAVSKRRGLEIGVQNAVQARVLHLEATRRDFDNQLSRGLEMAEDETAAVEVIRHAFALTVPTASIDLLLADNSRAHFRRTIELEVEGAPAGCSVDAPARCVAARRAHLEVFADSEALDACPLLRGRSTDPCTAVCVPVSIMGRTVGMTHAVRNAEQPFQEEEIYALQSIANQAGNRLGILRMMDETKIQASTDGLTGLTNRRAFENYARELRADNRDFALVMADLDHFKVLNDTFGHETGDRALRMFAQTLRAALREGDLACRYGGEEFVIVLTGADAHESIEIAERIRMGLRLAASAGDGPIVTASFGIAESADALDLDDLVARADHALFAAKAAGRDRICIDGYAAPVASTSAFG
jgi:diguanylate cyclase (GGDEF)-like protein